MSGWVLPENEYTNGVPSVRHALASAQQRIQSDSPRLDAEVLLLHVLNKTRVYLFSHPDECLTEAQVDAFQQLVARREQGEPIAHILCCREFWSLPFKVTADTLIPRPDTERLVELALSCPVRDRAKVLDLGSGTGAIACALAYEREAWQVLAIEKSKNALSVLRDNIKLLELSNVTAKLSDWFAAVPSQDFDIIVSNPPYIAEGDSHLSQGDLSFEPQCALVAGGSGMDDIELIINAARAYLCSNGWLLLEHGFAQGDKVKQLMRQAGYSAVVTERDLAGNERVTLGRWSGIK